MIWCVKMHVTEKVKITQVIRKPPTYQVSSPKHKAISMCFRMMSIVAPGTAAKYAARLIFTPPRRRIKGREYDLWLRASPFIVDFKDKQLVGLSWGYGPAVLLVHGWGGNSTQLSNYIHPLIRAGYRVVAFDAPAHGQSYQKQTNAVEFAETINRVANEINPVAVISYSLGAASTLIALDNGLYVDRIVSLASPDSMQTVIDIFANTLNLSEKATIKLKERIEKKIGRTMESISASSIVPRLTTPALIIHDYNDPLIPYEQGTNLTKIWSEAQLHSTSGLGHKGLIHDKKVIRKVIRFISN